MNLFALLFPAKAKRMDDLFNAHAAEQLRNIKLCQDNARAAVYLASMTKERDDLIEQLKAGEEEPA